MVELKDRVVRSSQSVDQATPDGHLVLDLGSGEYFEVGPVGGFIWEGLDGETDLAALAARMTEHFEVEPADAERDLLAFVQDLIGAGLAQVAG